jgi:hypothetical protein
VDIKTGIGRRLPKWTRFVALMVLVTVVVAGAITAREPILRAVGRALVVKESPAPANVIVIALDTGGAGVLEAADLVQSGMATQVAVFADPPSGDDLEFIRRGLPYEDEAARQIRQLEMLGVRNIMRIPRTDAGTEGEGQVLPAWSDLHQFRSIVIVVNADHSRRMRRVLDRAMKGHSTSVSIQPSRYSAFDPDRWWETRRGVRTAIIELQKLILDIVMHPMSF